MTTLSTSRAVGSTELRTQFAARLSALYGTEVPAYTSPASSGSPRSGTARSGSARRAR